MQYAWDVLNYEKYQAVVLFCYLKVRSIKQLFIHSTLIVNCTPTMTFLRVNLSTNLIFLRVDFIFHFTRRIK